MSNPPLFDSIGRCKLSGSYPISKIPTYQQNFLPQNSKLYFQCEFDHKVYKVGTYCLLTDCTVRYISAIYSQPNSVLFLGYAIDHESLFDLSLTIANNDPNIVQFPIIEMSNLFKSYVDDYYFLCNDNPPSLSSSRIWTMNALKGSLVCTSIRNDHRILLIYSENRITST